MAVFRDVLRTTLENDAPLAAILTGGVFDASELPQDGGGMSSFGRTADGITLKPMLVIRFRASNQFSASLINAERGTLELYFYQDVGYDQIELALTRTKALINHVFLTAADRAIAHLEYAYTSGDLMAEEMGDAPCRFMRFIVTDIRS